MSIIRKLFEKSTMYNFDICTKVVQRKCIPTTIGTYYSTILVLLLLLPYGMRIAENFWNRNISRICSELQTTQLLGGISKYSSTQHRELKSFKKSALQYSFLYVVSEDKKNLANHQMMKIKLPRFRILNSMNLWGA